MKARTIVRLIGATAVLSSIGLASSAYASPATRTGHLVPISGRPAAVNPQSCQKPNATLILRLANGGLKQYNCTGTYYPNARAVQLNAGGWSGEIQIGSKVYGYCDGWTVEFNGVVSALYLSPSKEPWC